MYQCVQAKHRAPAKPSMTYIREVCCPQMNGGVVDQAGTADRRWLVYVSICYAAELQVNRAPSSLLSLTLSLLMSLFTTECCCCRKPQSIQLSCYS